MKRDLYAEVSARIIAELERGAAPWVKPWSATPGQNVPQNAVTNRPYSGCNVILLWLARDRGWATPRFLTFKQALETGGHVRKGEHGTKVYCVKQPQVKDGEGEEADTRLIPMMREFGEAVFTHVPSAPSRPLNIGRALRVAIAMYRSRRTVQQRNGFREYDRAMPVPDIFQVRCMETDELFTVEACNAHTAAERAGSV